MQKLNLDKMLKVILMVAILVITGIVFWYFVIFVPQKAESEQKQRQFALDITRQQELDSCIKKAEDLHLNLVSKLMEGGPGISSETWDGVNNIFLSEKQKCEDKYPQTEY